jgi:hypothetical protein
MSNIAHQTIASESELLPRVGVHDGVEKFEISVKLSLSAVISLQNVLFFQ